MKILIPGLLLLAGLTAGCGGSSKKPAESGAPAAPAFQVDPAVAATIEGTISLEGTPPAETPIDMKADPTCGAAHSEPAFTEKAVVTNGRVQWTFVSVSAGLEGKNFGIPARPVLVDQQGCRYRPHVTGVVVNQEVEFLNSDETLHNVHAVCEANKAFNVGMPLKGMKQTRKFGTPEMVHLKCDVHPWMSAWLGVVPHPFFSVSDADGHFRIAGLPPGTYTIEAWHETFGTLTQEVTVGPAETKSADFNFKVTS